jgi:phosphoenolpyruvate carboxykinase (ATP)
LSAHGIYNIGEIFWNPTTSILYEQIARRREAVFAHGGPIVARTGRHTGRSPNDKFVVGSPETNPQIWWGSVNRPFESEKFDRIYQRQIAYLQGRDVFVQDCYAGADPDYRLRVRVINEKAWHNLFARNMFIRELDRGKLADFEPQFTILHTPGLQASPEVDGTASDAFVLVNFDQKVVSIGGTHYAGEIKKSVFSIMNYLLPQRDVLPMHCSANYGSDQNDAALFFGLSGTGKTTLSTAEDRTLIGDDEHGWSDSGIFNFEGGCYAKVIGIRPDTEPEIFNTTQKFGTILENVIISEEDRQLELDDDSITENTRGAYPLTHIPRADADGLAGHPKHVVFLTYDAFGVLPPVSRLTAEQAEYHFKSGYTSKVAGTETGVTEPQATFSTCFGAPFMPLRPKVYAEMLRERIDRHQAHCWLINTGLTGGRYGVGQRMSLSHTRAIVSAVLSGKLNDAAVQEEKHFGLKVPTSCPGAPSEILDPKATWNNAAEYDQAAQELAKLFAENYKKYE